MNNLLGTDKLRKVFTDESHQKEFIFKGGVKIPMLSVDEVNYLVNEIKQLRPDDNFAPSGNGEFSTSYHCSFLDTNLEYKRKTFNLINQIFAPYAKKYLNNFEILNANFYVKPPGTGTFQIHQNWHTLPDINDTTVTIWCPLQDTDEINGTLYSVEGSHKLLPFISGPSWKPFFYDFEDALVKNYLKPIPTKAGEAFIFDDSLIHWSPQNNSSSPRIAIQILCIPSECQPVYFHLDNEMDRFELMEVNQEFFIQSTIKDLVPRPQNLKTYGFAENINRTITEKEFVTLLKKMSKVRIKNYKQTDKVEGKSKFWEKILSYFK
ncbi:MAG TPA: phytanoyl-CoA dioxygenase family protein [Pyrinomonadaceae bacterium]|nr:phytanoyl-CoA dioxygenase family protein [Pyrinomonadaceae bacterium]